jgi:hypothetical protein
MEEGLPCWCSRTLQHKQQSQLFQHIAGTIYPSVCVVHCRCMTLLHTKSKPE